MNDKPSTAKPAPPWVFFTLVLGLAAYYAHDVWGGRFETIAYGFLCIAILGVLGVLLVLSAIMRKERPETDAEDPGPRTAGLPKSARPFLLLIILIAYGGMQAIAGFPIATFLAFVGLIWLFGERRWTHLLATGIGMSILAYVIFVQLLSIPVPEGALFH